jgi:KaiC/GvpD/RAD55 family RecA-like ATPase
LSVTVTLFLPFSQKPREMSGIHYCAVPKSFREHFAIIAPFLTQGLAQSQRCIFIAHDNGVEVARMALKSHGLQMDELQRDGRLMVIDSVETPLAARPLDAELLYRAWAEMTDATVAAGFSGLRVVVEMTWALVHDPEALARYEKGAAGLFANKPLDALCVYNWNVFQANVILGAAVDGHTQFLRQGPSSSPVTANDFCQSLGLSR